MKGIKNKKGFTLVELLVVLAIIGVLVGLAIAGMRIVQAVNRDTQRKAFITKDVQLLLEAYQDRNNKYPTTITVGTQGSGGCSTNEYPVEVSGATGTTPENACSKVGFDVSITSSATACDSFTGTEADSGKLTACYEGQGKGYELMVKVERSSEPYDASNV